MKRLKVKRVAILSLGLPGDWQERIGSARVAERAADLAQTPILQMPGVRAGDLKVIFGADRLAALHVSGETETDVQVWEADDFEAARARIVENLRRRNDNQDALKTALADLAASREAAVASVEQAEEAEADARETGPVTREAIRAQVEPKFDPPKRGRPKTSVGRARDEAASAAGTTSKAIKNAQVREKARAKEAAPAEDAIAGYETFGLPLPWPGVGELVAALDSADQQLRGVVARIGAAKEALEDAPLAPVRARAEAMDRLRARAQELGAEIRRVRPRSTCPYCKGSVEMEVCSGCRGVGYARGDQFTDVPPDLATGASIYVGGKLVPAAEVKAPRKKAPKIRIQDAETGAPLLPEEEPWEDSQ